jgi:capsid protein
VGLLDKAIGLAEKLAPEWGLRREHARLKREMIVAQGYSQHGASRTKKSLQGWVTATGGPESDITLNLDLLRQRSRDLYMGDPLAGGALKTIRTNEIGAGLRLNAQIDQEFLGLSDEQALAWEANTEREFSLWANTVNCDSARRHTFGQITALARLSQLMSGDVFVLLPSIQRAGDRYDLKIKLLEADRVSDPWPYPIGKDVLGGVEVDGDGATVAFYVSRVHPGDLFVPRGIGGYGAYGAFSGGGTMELPPVIAGSAYGTQYNIWDRVPAFGVTGRRLVLHMMESERPGQRRGVPILAPVIEHLKQLSRYSYAELMAAVVSGMFTAAITSERPTAMPGQVTPPDQQIKDNDPNSYQLGNGAVLGLLPGEHLETANPGRPNAGFDPFVRSIAQQISAGLGLSRELLVKEFTASYSASRAALLEAWKVFVVGRKNTEIGFCQPTYEQWLEEAVARGYISAPGFFSDPVTRAAWCGAEWNGPTQGQLDPTKEVEAATLRVNAGFSTRTRETAELTGGNFERFNKVREREERIRRDAGVADPPPTPMSTPAPQKTEEEAA